MNTNPVPTSLAKIKAEANAWWVRLDSGRLDADGRAEFAAWLKANPLHGEAFGQVNQLWQELDGLKGHLAATMPVPVKKAPRVSRWQWGVSAFATGCLLVLLINPMTLWLRADVATSIGETRSLQLADGSMAYLNSDSALSIEISKNARRLTLLKGEALFKVSPDPARPFQVRAGEGMTTALGTAFNVHKLKGGVEVTVIEHGVAVDFDNGSGKSKRVEVASGQQVFYSIPDGLSGLKPVDTHITTAWQRGKLVFQDKPLGEVIDELNHYHHGYFLISDTEIARRRVNGVFSTDKPLDALDAIEKSLHLRSNRLAHYLVLLHR